MILSKTCLKCGHILINFDLQDKNNTHLGYQCVHCCRLYRNEEIAERCPNCASIEIWKNSSGEVQCDNCGYEEIN